MEVKMKNSFFLLLTIFAVCLIGGCKANHFDNTMPTSSYEAIGLLESKLFEEKKDDLDVKISFPQFSNNENITAEKVNKIIKETAINNYYKQWNLKGLTLDQTYNIEKQGSEFLSIVFYGYIHVAGTAHPTNSCHAVTMNLKTAETYTLSHFIKSYDDLENNILDGKYEVLYGGLKALNSDEVLSIIHDSFENTPINENATQFYISEDDSLCIIIDVPHAAGDYSIVKIDSN